MPDSLSLITCGQGGNAYGRSSQAPSPHPQRHATHRPPAPGAPRRRSANWKMLQDDYDCYFMIADYHALMSESRPPTASRPVCARSSSTTSPAAWTPPAAVIFRQSDVPEHAELHLILSCYTPISWLERNPTYKEQLQRLASKISATTPSWATRSSRPPTSSFTGRTSCRWARTSCRTWN